MNKRTFAFTLSLMLAWVGSTALAQNAPDNPPTIPADSKPPTKSPKAESKKTKSSKKDSAKQDEAKPLTPGPAVVQSKNVNVRDEGAIKGVVITHLNRGDHVNVLEEISITHPKTDEPSKWAKIALPEGVAGAWVFAPFVDSATHTVSKPKLNVRSGPGENFGKINTIAKGTAVKEIERKGDWMKIEPPAGSYAFVAAHLIANDTAAAIVSTPKPTPAVAVIAPPPVTTPPPPPPPATEVAVVKPVVIGADPTAPPPAPTPIVTTPPPAPITVPPPVENSAISKISLEPATPAGATKGEVDEDVKRVVTREGIVRRSVSIQAPTYFALEDPRTGKTINYVHSTNLFLKDFWGRRVLVTGEEELDERWPNKPVITVDTLKPVD